MRRDILNIGLLVLAASLLASSCAPRVVSDMFTSEFAPVDPATVRVFLLGDSVPERSLAIGEVKVVDNGLSVNGSYPRVLQMAIEESARNGGNGLVIKEHRSPDHISTIDRLWGTIIRTDSTGSDSLAAWSVKRAQAYAYHDTNRQYNESAAYQRKTTQRKQEARDLVRVKAGPSWMTSEYVVLDYTYSGRCGFDAGVDFDHLWSSGLGFGFNYLHNYTSFDDGIVMRTDYFGPSFVYAYATEKWQFDIAYGLGYVNYSEKLGPSSYSESALGVMLRIGGEVKLSDRLALCLQTGMQTIRLKKPEDYTLDKNEFYGIKRLFLQFGLSYYF